MADLLSRRGVLRAAGVAVVAGTSGCQLDNPTTAAGHVYAENDSGSSRRVAFFIRERTDGGFDDEIAAWYRVPNDHALEFENVLEAGRTHVIHAALPGSPPTDEVTLTVDPCQEGEAGDRVITVDLQPDGLGIVPRGCQASYTQRELEYVPAAEYRLEPLERTPTVTPSA